MTMMLERPITAPEESEYHIDGWANDYENSSIQNYSDNTDSTPISWESVNVHDQVTPIEYLKTAELSLSKLNQPSDLDVIEATSTIEEALREYRKRYSVEAAYSGEKSPQDAAIMLHRIFDKFAGQMTEEESHWITLERVAMGHAIGHLAEVPADAAVDRITLQGATELTSIITEAQEGAPGEVNQLKEDLLAAAARVESRSEGLKEQQNSRVVTHSIIEPILAALEQSAKQPDEPFEKIVTKEDLALLTLANSNLEQREITKAKERADKERAQKERLALARIAARRAHLDSNNPTATGVYSPKTAAVAATGMISLADLEAEDEAA